jgi:preprotein translocase subunit SecG
MANVLIVAYLLIVVALIAVILLQRSEGGGLGMGSNSNGLISVRGSANLLTRTTAILATLFFVLAITLTILAELNRGTDDILQKATETGTQPATVLDALKQLQDQNTTDLPVPATTAPATTTTDGAATTTAPAATTTAPAATTTAPASEAAPSTTAPAATAPATTEQPAAPSN